MNMRPFREVVPYEKAFSLLMDAVVPVDDVEEVSLDDALNMVCAVDVVSELDVPGFDRAAMDGYAVRADDTYGASHMNPVGLRVVGEVFAGEKPSAAVEPGTCVAIATGAVLPEGASAVVPVEETEMDSPNVVKIKKPVYPGANVSKRGVDIKRGDVVLSRGSFLSPPRIGVLAALGFERVRVYRRPRVLVVSTGSEVVPQGKPLEVGKVYDINRHTVAGVLALNGADVTSRGPVEDSVDEIEKALGDLNTWDMVVITGGSSVGERDLLVDLFESRGDLLFHGVAVKPGKPTLAALAKNGRTLMVGMPGYPTSCLSNAYLFLVPAIRKMAHLPPAVQRKVRAKMGERVTSTLGRHQFLTVRLEHDMESGGGDGAVPVAIPAFKESGAITSMALADGYVEIPANVDLLEKGDVVDVVLF